MLAEAMSNPAAALVAKDQDLKDEIADTWLKREPRAAVECILQLDDSAKQALASKLVCHADVLTEIELWELVQSYPDEIAELDSQRGLALLREIPGAAENIGLLKSIVRNWDDANLGSAFTWIDGQPENLRELLKLECLRNRDESTVVEMLAGGTPSEVHALMASEMTWGAPEEIAYSAKAWLNGLSESQRSDWLVEALSRDDFTNLSAVFRTDLLARMDVYGQVHGDEAKWDRYSQIVERWADSEPDAAKAFIEMERPSANEATVALTAQLYLDKSSRTARDLAGAVRFADGFSPEVKYQLLEGWVGYLTGDLVNLSFQGPQPEDWKTAKNLIDTADLNDADRSDLQQIFDQARMTRQ